MRVRLLSGQAAQGMPLLSHALYKLLQDGEGFELNSCIECAACFNLCCTSTCTRQAGSVMSLLRTANAHLVATYDNYLSDTAMICAAQTGSRGVLMMNTNQRIRSTD